VTVLTHAPRLDGSKLPAEGPGLGLGALEHEAVHALDAYEASRERVGVRRSTPTERRQAVSRLHRQQSIEQLELEVERVKRQRTESARDWDTIEMRISLHRSVPLTHMVRLPGSIPLPSGDKDDDVGLSDMWD
jgi:hypothetical protein